MAVSPATYAHPLPHMPPCHAYPPTMHAPPAMHAPTTHAPPAMHAPCHTHPLCTHASLPSMPPVDRQTPLKTLPFRNYRCDGNNAHLTSSMWVLATDPSITTVCMALTAGLIKTQQRKA